jgi:hypothetical protein
VAFPPSLRALIIADAVTVWICWGGCGCSFWKGCSLVSFQNHRVTVGQLMSGFSFLSQERPNTIGAVGCSFMMRNQMVRCSGFSKMTLRLIAWVMLPAEEGSPLKSSRGIGFGRGVHSGWSSLTVSMSMKQSLAPESTRVRTFFEFNKGIVIARVREFQGHEGIHD